MARILLPILLLTFTNLRLLLLIHGGSYDLASSQRHGSSRDPGQVTNQGSAAGHVTQCSAVIGWVVQARHRVYIHLAIVLLDILCNILPLGLIVWEMVDFHRVAACHNFNSEETFGNYTSYLVLNDIGIRTIH